MFSLVLPKLYFCDQQTLGFVPKSIQFTPEAHCPQALVLKGMVVKELVWESHEPILWPPYSSSTGV